MKWQQKLGNSLGNNSSQTRCFDPKKRLPGRAKLLISEQQALGLSNLLNRCRGQNSYRGFESPLSASFKKSANFPIKLRNPQRNRVLLPRLLPFAENVRFFFLTTEYFISGETSMNRVRVMIRAKVGGKYPYVPLSRPAYKHVSKLNGGNLPLHLLAKSCRQSANWLNLHTRARSSWGSYKTPAPPAHLAI
jgi:hypothetical protein